MQVTVSEPQKSLVTLRIEVEEKGLEKYLDRAAKELSKDAKIPGFRPGKVPRNVLEQHLGEGALRAYALDLALPQFYAEAVIQEKVQVVARPEIKLVSDTPFVFEAIVPVLPEVKISGYDKIKIEKKETDMKDEEVEEMIDQLRKQQATYEEVNREAKIGDRAEIDFDGFDPKGDVPLEGTSSKNHPVILGENSLIPGFEEEIVGMKAGDDKEFEITFPKDYHSQKFQGKKVKFKIKLHRVQEVKLPEVNSEWIKSVMGEEMTPEAFRNKAKENLIKQRENNEQTRRENEFLDELLKLAKMDIPEALIEEEIDFILDRTKMDLEGRGLSWKQYSEYLEKQGRNLREEKQQQAEKQVKMRIVLHHLYKVEKIEIDESEVMSRVNEMAESYPEAERERLTQLYTKGTKGYSQIENSLLLEKFFKKFLT